jgi:ligand-binding sensor domain-containing protein
MELHSQREELTFEHLTLQTGFPDQGFELIFKDSYGFVWIGTHSGLTRYDGNELIVYKHSDDNGYC